MIKMVDKAREAVDTMAPSAEGIKAAALNTCRSAVDMCRGTTIKGEIGKLASACVSAPAETVASSLKAVGQLCTIQPVKATCTAAKGLKKIIGHTMEAVTSPIRFTGAAAKTSVSAVKKGAHATKEAVKTIVSLPVTAPLKVLDMAGNGVIKLENALGIGDSASSAPANDNAEKDSGEASTPPPQMADAA